jgi:hypothetical protein
MAERLLVGESAFSCLFSFLPKKANHDSPANPQKLKGALLKVQAFDAKRYI